MVVIPSSTEFDGSVLARTLDNMTASYKVTMAKSILYHVAEGGDELIPYDRLLRGMLKALWYPVARYRLRLGSADLSADYFAGVPEDVQMNGTFEDAVRDMAIEVRNPRNMLLRWPIRIFLVPWFEAGGVRVSSADTQKSSFQATSNDPGRGFYLPYSIAKEGLRLDRKFLDYLLGNMFVLEGWTDMRLVEYLQSRNPNIPGIPLKLRPQERVSLASQKQWWEQSIKAGEFRCIYTGAQLDPGQYHLDHFLPWRFVAHDRIWNLVPSHPSINLSKGARIPDPSLVAGLADAHFRVVNRTVKGSGRTKDFIEEYLDDLGLELDLLKDVQAFRRGYEETVMPLLALARRRFPVWIHGSDLAVR